MRKKKEDMTLLGGDNESDETYMERKSTNTAFVLMFPALILAGIAGLFTPTIYGKLLVIALAIYQFIMLKKFILDYYKK
jgi:hypothetical protein